QLNAARSEMGDLQEFAARGPRHFGTMDGHDRDYCVATQSINSADALDFLFVHTNLCPVVRLLA
ncbi:hypothetical protein, partial [Lysobacter sp. TAB13]|uniref:hypothetical protein n=1 Tax=Lysobacter sp. TAB13 TaxID=3233065 RepID=UPI003F99D283